MNGTIEELKKLLSNKDEFISFVNNINPGKIYTVGLRGFAKNDHHESGSLLPTSFDWVDGNRTDDQLCGTCAVSVSPHWYDEDFDELDIPSFGMVDQYSAGRIGLVIGDGYSHGQDRDEIIIQNAKLIYIWE